MNENREQSEGLGEERAQRRRRAALRAVEWQGRRPAGEERGPPGRGMPPPPLKWQWAGTLRGTVATEIPGLRFGFRLGLVAWKSKVTIPGFSKMDPTNNQAAVNKGSVPHLYSRSCGKWLMQE